MKWSLASLKADFQKIEWYKRDRLMQSCKMVLAAVFVSSCLLYALDLLLFYGVDFVKWLLRFILG